MKQLIKLLCVIFTSDFVLHFYHQPSDFIQINEETNAQIMLYILQCYKSLMIDRKPLIRCTYHTHCLRAKLKELVQLEDTYVWGTKKKKYTTSLS